jgi:hypothetical protein
MLYSVTYWDKCTYEPGWYDTKRHIVGSKKEAEALANEWLGVANESLYGSRVNRRPFVSVSKCVRLREKGSGVRWYQDFNKVCDIEQPVNIVPSVGDLGYTP